ncbi:hypothetical protein PBRA_000654 [Plasmodiophora brassicae]|uniref:E3 UFM1-protein ligase 1 homolog n=1 Tax=Plasmodiophora brassicae TaxID=37360 RepID=A0A0G4IQ85_PLABS|nr:hypothetical protein PBRA_000654 [Plasmodiophora brassicae]
MDELAALQAEFERAQCADVVQRLSERNCIEIVLRLIATERIRVLSSSTGKEFVTPGRLRSEIIEEVRSNGGRLSMTDLPELLNVDLVNIEKAVHELAASSAISLIAGDLIHKSYIDAICQEIAHDVEEAGLLTASSLSQQYGLPVALITSALTERLGTLTDGPAFHVQNQTVFTDSYVATHNAKVRGLLTACTKPTSLQSLVSTYSLNEKMFRQYVQSAVESGQLPGTLSGSTSGLGLYTPEIWCRAQEKSVRSFYTQNNFIELSRLTEIGISKPVPYLTQLFPSGIAFPRVFVSPAVVETVCVSRIDVGNNPFTRYVVVPEHLAHSDVPPIVENVVNAVNSAANDVSQKCHHVSKYYVVSSVFLRACATHVEPTVLDLAKQAAIAVHSASKNRPAAALVSPENDAKKSKKRSGKKGQDNDSEQGSTSKKRSSRRADADLEEQFVLGRPVLDTNVLRDELSQIHSQCDDMLINGIVSIIAPSFKTQFEQIRDSPFIMAGGENVEAPTGVPQRRKLLKEFTQTILVLLEHYQVFLEAIQELNAVPNVDGGLITALDKYLVKTVGSNLADTLLRIQILLNGVDLPESAKGDLTPELRSELLSKVAPVISQELTAMLSMPASACLNAARDIAAKTDILVKESTRKRIKLVVFGLRKQLQDQLRAESRPEAVLLLAVILAHARSRGIVLHAPSQCIDSLVIVLKASEDELVKIRALQEAIRSRTPESDVPPELIADVKSLGAGDRNQDPDRS